MSDLPVAPLLLRDAHALGIKRSTLRGAEWRLVTRGVYVAAREDVPDGLEAASLLAPALPRSSGFGHLTGAGARGWWMPHQLGSHVAFATTRSRVHVTRSGLYVRRSEYAEVETVGGVPLMTAPQTLLELARDLTLVDLVPMVDCALAGGANRAEVLAVCRPKAYGSARLRQALLLADERSESWWESVLRLQHSLTGLGPVECQVDISDDHGFVARADLHLVGTRRYPECDGGEHRTKDRHAHDLKRDKALARLDAERFGYTTEEIAHRPETVIRDAEDARQLPHDPSRLRMWWRHARPSTLTAYGRTRLAARLDRYRRAGSPLLATSGASERRNGAATRQESD